MLESRGLFLSDWHGSLVASRVFMEAISVGSVPALIPVFGSGHMQISRGTRLRREHCGFGAHGPPLPPSGEPRSPKPADKLPSAYPVIGKRVSLSLRRGPRATGFHTEIELFVCSFILEGIFLTSFWSPYLYDTLQGPAVPARLGPPQAHARAPPNSDVSVTVLALWRQQFLSGAKT